MAKKRTKRRPQGGQQPAPAPPVAVQAEPVRLPWTMTTPQRAAVAIAGLGAIAAYAGLPHFTYYKDNPQAALAITFAVLGAAFVIDRRFIMLTPRASVRFAGFGVLAPLLWYFLPFGAGAPIAALAGMTVYRLGIGSVFAPALVGTMLTGISQSVVTGTQRGQGPVAGMLVAVAFVLPGMGALLMTRRQPG
jgi:hypothetical protein